MSVSYTVAPVDIGYKGTAKCWNKQSEEERFCELAAKGAKGCRCVEFVLEYAFVF